MVPDGSIVLKSLREQVYDYLRVQLRNGALQPGSTLDLNALADGLGVSRTPLRDALLQLEVEGFVTILPRRGVMVNKLELKDIKDLYMVVGALESSALLAAAPDLTPQDLARMRELDQECQAAFEAGDSEAAYEANYKYHEVFLERCGNEPLHRLVRTKRQQLYDFQRKLDISLAWERVNHGEHEEIVKALEEGRHADAVVHLRDVHWGFHHQESYIRAAYFGE